MISDPTLLALAQRNRRRRERKQAAEPGPWGHESCGGGACYKIAPLRPDGSFDWSMEIAATSSGGMLFWANAVFIAEARNDPVEDDVDLLLAEVRRLRGEETK